MANPVVDRITKDIAQVSGLPWYKAASIVQKFQDTFAKPFAAKLNSLHLRTIIQNKNPYLYRASGIETCEDLVRRALQDYVSASVEGYFGPFFESVAQVVSGHWKPAGGGEVDLEVRVGNIARLYVIKSGAKGFNSSSYDKARRDLESAERRLRQDRVRVEKKIAFAYGRRTTAFRGGIEHLASKDFWAEISGDPEFYKKLLEICRLLAPLYTADMQAPFNGLVAEAHELFCEDDKVNWDKVLRIVSG